MAAGNYYFVASDRHLRHLMRTDPVRLLQLIRAYDERARVHRDDLEKARGRLLALHDQAARIRELETWNRWLRALAERLAGRPLVELAQAQGGSQAS